jgi:uncharacterized protein
MALWALLALGITLVGVWLGYAGARFALVALVLALLLAGQIFSGARGFQEKLKQLAGQAGLLLFPLLLGVLFVIYLAGTGNYTWQRLVGGLAWIEAPALLELGARGKPAGRWQDYAAMVALWLPLEFHWASALFPYPRGATHTLAILFGLNAGIIAFLFLRELDGVGYTIAWGAGFTAAVVVNFLIFAAIAIPLGEWMHFIRFAPSLGRLKSLPLSALGITLFTAWPEEFLFRGLLQNLLSKSLRSANLGWIAASVLFGLSHIVHGFPNWRYVALATIAGLFYGRAWSKSRSLTTSCLVHALVDNTWHTLFV